MKKKITQKWIEYAERDLKVAQVLFNEKIYETSAWHCHQSIEKILKAIIDAKNKRIPKIHDLVGLLELSEEILPKDLRIFINELNSYYLPPRYPDMAGELQDAYSRKNISKVLKLTKDLLKWLKLCLNQ